jgi:hypothetical protein
MAGIDLIKSIFKNKIFLWTLLIINLFIFSVGFLIEDSNLMILAVLSYGSTLLGLYISTKGE